MKLRLTVNDRYGRSDVSLATEPDAPLSEVLALLVADGAGQPTYLGPTLLETGWSVGQSGLHDGAVLQVGGPGASVRDPQSDGIEIRVVGGPSAGMVVRVGPGRHLIGRQQGCAVSLDDLDASREHAALEISVAGELCVTDLGSTNGTFLEGAPVTDCPVALELDQFVQIGRSYITVSRVEPPDPSLTPDGDGGFVFNRRYRIRHGSQQVKVDLPREPTPMDKPGFPWVVAIAPLVIAGGMALLTHTKTFLLLALMSPVMAVGSTFTERRTRRKKAAREEANYQQALDEATAKIDASVTDERSQLRTASPDPALSLLTALGPRDRLWERRSSDPDHLLVRIGLGTPQAQLVVTNEGGPPPELWATPVTVALPELGVLGIAADRRVGRGIARAALLQISALHSPDDVRVVLLTDSDTEDPWQWVEWLPHAQLDTTRGLVGIGNTPDTIGQRMKELQRLISSRPSRSSGRSVPAKVDRPVDVVVVVDGASRLRGVPGMLSLLQQGPDVGIFSICIDQSRELLPEECGGVVVFDHNEAKAEVAVHGAAPERDVIPDQVSPSLVELAARALAPIHRTGGDATGSIPSSARLLEALDLDPPSESAIIDRWNAGGPASGVIGLTATGPITLDLAGDGPHGLVAGTTGAGKSELLQTLACSLAVANTPEDLNFVFVDYKGGAAFRGFLDLPHTVGMVTDLDGHLTERALRSLRAELKRREHQLGTVGAKDITDYRDARRRSITPVPPMPRLAIVIDEFASLVEELPDFIKGLVGIAQLGRALGVHLILATQRPTGVVSPEIRANSNFAIALRVVNSAESSDVIGSGLASTISPGTPGRAYLRISQEQAVSFQTARVGGRRPGVAEGRTPSTVRPMEWERLGLPDPLPPKPPAVDDASTDLHALVEAIHDAAGSLGIPAQAQPWLDPLPDVVVLEDLVTAPATGPQIAPLPIGIEDLPDLQRQDAAVVDVTSGRHVLVAGSPRSGRSTFLRAVAASIARLCSPADVHLYALDYGNGALTGLKQLPHCGVVISRSQPDRAERLMSRLNTEMDRRHAALVELGASSATEQRQRSGGPSPVVEAWPYLVVLLDNWEEFTDTFRDHKDGVVEQQFLRLLRDGGAVGVTVVTAGDRSLLSTARIASLVEEKLVLRFNDRDDYTLAGLSPRSMPTTVAPGRAFRSGSGDELQIALLDRDPSGPAQNAALAIIAATGPRPEGDDWPSPFRVDAQPTRIGLDAALALGPRSQAPFAILAGVGGDELAPFWIHLEDTGSAFLVVGSPESGRSCALVSIARTLGGQGTRVVALAPRPSPLRSFTSADGEVIVFSGQEARSPDLTSILADPRPVALLIDDAEDVDSDNPSVAAFLAPGSGQRALIVAGPVDDVRDAFRGFLVQARRPGTGLLLSPKSHLDGTVFGTAMPRGSAFSGPPGRGHLFVRGRYASLVQMPFDELA